MAKNHLPHNLISHEEFIRAWMASNDYDEIEKLTGMSRVGIKSRAYRLRRKGVRLPRLKTEGGPYQPVNVADLNQLIDNGARPKRRD